MRPVIVIRGHGLTSCGTTVAEAVLRAVSTERLARLELSIASAAASCRIYSTRTWPNFRTSANASTSALPGGMNWPG
jgi:ribulose-5-phosphate 4-epimerase/fuculose-1-phosphate aldolase